LLLISLARLRAQFPPRTAQSRVGSSVAFSAATSIATIGLYISYVRPAGLIPFLHLHYSDFTVCRDTDRAACAIRGPFRARAVSSQQALARNRLRRHALDRVYRGRVLSPAAKPR
jgi:hypothetical protein